MSDTNSDTNNKPVAAAATREKPTPSPPNHSLLARIDRILLRVNKLLATPNGATAALSTTNYILYILAYTQTKLPAGGLSALLLRFLHLPLPTASKSPAQTQTQAVPALAALAVLLSKARTTLRLLGLFPLYAWLRSLSGGPKPGGDHVVHAISVLQASCYFVYQALENVCLLADSGVVPGGVIAALNRGDPRTARVYLWAYRCWLGGVACEFLRLGREYAVNVGWGDERAEGEADRAWVRRWRGDLLVAGAWLPMALHFSSATGGLPGWNLGWMGLCGLVAGGGRTAALWRSTA